MQVPALSQAVARGLATGSGTFNEDWEAVFAAAGITTGTFNERLLMWLNGQLGSAYVNVNEAQAAFLSVPPNAIANDQSGYVINDSGGYVLAA